jgi:Flp pilus assembly protein TadG
VSPVGGLADHDRRDRGSTSLTTVLLTPVFVVVAFAAFQAALWSHARTQVRAMARDVAVLVAQRGADTDLIEAEAEANLDDASAIVNPDVTIAQTDGLVVVTVAAEAPGIMRWTSSDVEATEVLPLEGFRR